MRSVTKQVFLSAVACPTLGWMWRSGELTRPLEEMTLGDRFRIEQGQEIGRRARGLYPGGVLVAESDMAAASAATAAALDDPAAPALFEAAFLVDGYAARADVLRWTDGGWHLIEVKSSVNDREEFIDDMAYTAMVVERSGLDIRRVCLLLVSRDFRLGMPDEALFVEVDHTDEVRQRVEEFQPLWRDIEEVTRLEQRPEPSLTFDCRRCELFDECLRPGIDNHVFDLPRLSQARFDTLAELGIVRIEDIPDGLPLTEKQEMVRDCVRRGEPFVDAGLRNDLAAIDWPACYLDFETVMTAIPLYPGVAPYEQIPTQYSIHRCSQVGNITGHSEYLADPSHDCRRELASSLLRDLGEGGSIIVYSTFEMAVVNSLARLFPDLAAGLLAARVRMVDLAAIIGRNYYHPRFRGSTSIKVTLPVLVPEMSYEGLPINDGGSAAAAFAYLALGRYSSPADVETVRRDLLEYCKQDTLGMVRLHQGLAELA
jgi:CRISPR/Cas system-associated exonuclease Cas4 (RecB family)